MNVRGEDTMVIRLELMYWMIRMSMQLLPINNHVHPPSMNHVEVQKLLHGIKRKAIERLSQTSPCFDPFISSEHFDFSECLKEGRSVKKDYK